MTNRSEGLYIVFNLVALGIVPFLITTFFALLSQLRFSDNAQRNTPYLLVSAFLLVLFNLNYAIPLLVIGQDNVDKLATTYCSTQWTIQTWLIGVISFIGFRLAWELRSIVSQPRLPPNRQNPNLASSGRLVYPEVIWWCVILLVPAILSIAGYFWALHHGGWGMGLYTCGSVDPLATFIKTLDIPLAFVSIAFVMNALYKLYTSVNPVRAETPVKHSRKGTLSTVDSFRSELPDVSKQYISQSSSIKWRLAVYVTLYVVLLASVGASHILNLASRNQRTNILTKSGVSDFASLSLSYFYLAVFGTTASCLRWHVDTFGCLRDPPEGQTYGYL